VQEQKQVMEAGHAAAGERTQIEKQRSALSLHLQERRSRQKTHARDGKRSAVVAIDNGNGELTV
jgi:hypothetical protein